ncbi:MAG: hypothetical protein OEU46_00035 [Alphaproteobacteria bacterium]|nr:hypothetical protein [Alphaproteobacteria bacterium]
MPSLLWAIRTVAALTVVLLLGACVIQQPPHRTGPGPGVTPAPVPGPDRQARFTHARYAGPFSCKRYGRRAFFDPRKGGQCWKCPGSHPQRTVLPVTGKRACQPRGTIVSLGGVRAKYMGKRCPAGAFKQRGAKRCFKCPAGYRPHNIKVKTDLRQVRNACISKRR